MRFKKLSESAQAPKRASVGSAGYDLFADLHNGAVSVEPGETKMISTGIAMEIPLGTFGAIFARSGLASKRGLRPANCVGVIDPDYRGEVMVAIHNDSREDQVIKPGDRIAQLLIIPCGAVDFVEANELISTDRGSGGFGSTGTA